MKRYKAGLDDQFMGQILTLLLSLDEASFEVDPIDWTFSGVFSHSSELISLI